MKNLKENKGITLVSLIITIIILLILAVIATSAVNEERIISKAKLAKTNDQVSQDEENTILQDYVETNIVEEKNGGNNKETSTKIKKYNITGLKDLSQISTNDLPTEDFSFIFVSGVPKEGEKDYLISDFSMCWDVSSNDLIINNDGAFLGPEHSLLEDFDYLHTSETECRYDFNSMSWETDCGKEYVNSNCSNFNSTYLLKDSINWTAGNLTASEMEKVSLFINIKEITE